MENSQTAHATPPDESGWSFSALLGAFAASLPMWMQKFGVPAADVEDATQEALVEAWQGLAEIPAARDDARVRMLRIAARVAQRVRRRAARLVCVDELDAADMRDFEAWIAARMLWLEALYRLDEPARKLVIAHHIDERTYEQIGAEMGIKARTVRQRVEVADKKLREELDKLTGNDKRGKRGAAVMGVGVVLDPFERAVFRAILDVEEEFGLAPPPASRVRPRGKVKPWPWQVFPCGMLAIALFSVPGQGWRTVPLYADKFAMLPLRSVEAHSATGTPYAARAAVQPALPGKTATPIPKAAPTLNDKGRAIVKNLRKTGRALGGR